LEKFRSRKCFRENLVLPISLKTRSAVTQTLKALAT